MAPILRGIRFERAAGALADGSPEVFIQGIERVGPDLGEGSSECSFDPIDGMKEVSTVHFELPGAELPVGAQEEVVAEESMICVIERSPAYRTEVGHVFFLFSGVDAPAARAGAEFPGNRTEGRPSGVAIPETGKTGPENGPKNAIAWRSSRSVNHPRSAALAILARFSSHPNRV